MCKQILGVKKFANNIKVSKQKCISISKDFHLLKQTDTYSKPSKEKKLIQKSGFRI